MKIGPNAVKNSPEIQNPQMFFGYTTVLRHKNKSMASQAKKTKLDS